MSKNRSTRNAGAAARLPAFYWMDWDEGGNKAILLFIAVFSKKRFTFAGESWFLYRIREDIAPSDCQLDRGRNVKFNFISKRFNGVVPVWQINFRRYN